MSKFLPDDPKEFAKFLRERSDGHAPGYDLAVYARPHQWLAIAKLLETPAAPISQSEVLTGDARLPPVARIEMVQSPDGYEIPATPIFRVMVDKYCIDFETETAAGNVRNAILALGAAQAVQEPPAGLAEAIAAKLKHPIFQGLRWETYDAYLPLKFVGPCSVTDWYAKTPNGKEIIVSAADKNDCISLHDAIIPEASPVPSADRETTKTRAKAPRIESVSCVHAAIISLDGMWHCQKCGDAIDMAVAHTSTPSKTGV